MPESFHKRLNQKLQEVKENKVLCQYLWCIGVSILLGIGLESKLFDYLLGKPIPLINQFLNTSNSSPIDHSLVFSTSAAILSTIFTIIFVLLTVFVQMSADAFSSANVFRSKETKYLMSLYFSTIILSLIMLETVFQYPILVLTLTFACILSLYPFLRNIGDKLVYNVGIGKLCSEISLQIKSDNEPSARVKIMSLSNTCKMSIKDDHWVAFIEIMSILEEITIMAKEKHMTTIIRIIGINYSNLLNLLIKDKTTKINRNSMIMIMEMNILTYVSNCSEMADSKFLNSILVIIPLNTVTNRIKDGFKEDILNESIVILCYKLYSELEKRGTDDYIKDTEIIDSLGELAKESYNQKLSRSITISIGALFTIGVKESQVNEKSVHLSALVVNKLKEIEDYISPEYFENVYNDFNRISHISWAFGESKLEPYFDNFKELYDKSK